MWKIKPFQQADHSVFPTCFKDNWVIKGSHHFIHFSEIGFD